MALNFRPQNPRLRHGLKHPTKWAKRATAAVAVAPRPRKRIARPSPAERLMLQAKDKLGRLPRSPAHAAFSLGLTVNQAQREFARIAQDMCAGLRFNRAKTVRKLVAAMMEDFKSYRPRGPRRE